MPKRTATGLEIGSNRKVSARAQSKHVIIVPVHLYRACWIRVGLAVQYCLSNTHHQKKMAGKVGNFLQ
jgi:hypothetical protein